MKYFALLSLAFISLSCHRSSSPSPEVNNTADHVMLLTDTDGLPLAPALKVDFSFHNGEATLPQPEPTGVKNITLP